MRQFEWFYTVFISFIVAKETLEGHQRAIMGTMSVEEIYRDRKTFSSRVFDTATADLVNMGITVVSYTLKDIRDDEVNILYAKNVNISIIPKFRFSS